MQQAGGAVPYFPADAASVGCPYQSSATRATHARGELPAAAHVGKVVRVALRIPGDVVDVGTARAAVTDTVVTFFLVTLTQLSSDGGIGVVPATRRVAALAPPEVPNPVVVADFVGVGLSNIAAPTSAFAVTVAVAPAKTQHRDSVVMIHNLSVP